MKSLVFFPLLFALFLGTSPQSDPPAEEEATASVRGSITGKVVYEGKVPNLKPYDMSNDPACAAKHDGAPGSDMLVLGDGNTLGNVFVQVKNAPEGDYKAPDEPVIITLSGCLSLPRVAGAMVGQTVQFKNSDGILHNVHGLPKVNREFNIGMPPSLKEKDVSFNKPEPAFGVKCDVHPWMQSYVAVMTHPYFRVTGEDGRFAIPDLPAGTYEVEAWHEHLGKQTATVKVGEGAAGVDFSFKTPSR